jgi:chromosome segregation ATPase
VERLRTENEALSRKCNELDTELATVKTERDDYAATVDEFIKDYKSWQQKALTPEKRDRILAALGVGKQSPQYKRVKAVLDQLMP